MELDKNSLLYWYKKTKELNIPQPETKIIHLTKKDISRFWDSKISKKLLKKITKIAKDMGFPIFIRTDQASNKHNWKNSSFIQNKNDISKCVIMTTIYNITSGGILGLPFKAIVLREFIPLNSSFTAFFGDLPISKERRYFINEGKIQCHHPYWPIKSIENPSVKNWKKLLMELNQESKEEIQLLSKYALMVTNIFKGYWSIDFAETKEGKWILIDMAKGENSFHHLNCQYCSQEMREYYERHEKIKKQSEEFFKKLGI